MTRIDEMVRAIHRTLDRAGYLPVVETASSSCSASKVTVRGREFVNFSVNGYLSLGNHPRVVDAAIRAAREFGAAAGASRFTGGTHAIHRALEDAIADFKDPSGRKKCIVYSTGYLANLGAIPALTSPHLLELALALNPQMEKSWGTAGIFSDRLNHRCLIDAAMLAAAWARGQLEMHVYNHLDVGHLQRRLSESSAERKLIVTDGVFSLHGHIAPLRDIVRVAEEHGATVFLDDAHGTGVLGEHGRGTAEHHGVEDRVHIHMGTLSKALGGAGGFVVADEDVTEYLRYSSSTYMFQTAMPPAIAAGVTEAIAIVQSPDGKELRRKLWLNIQRCRSALTDAGFDILGSQTQIIPVLVGDEWKTKVVAEDLKESGIFAPCYYYPAVPRGQAIVRINLMTGHTFDDIDRLIGALTASGKKHGII